MRKRAGLGRHVLFWRVEIFSPASSLSETVAARSRGPRPLRDEDAKLGTVSVARAFVKADVVAVLVVDLILGYEQRG